MDQELKEQLKNLEEEIDYNFGKIKRFMMQGWLSKPAYLRAVGWFFLGGIVSLMLEALFKVY